MATSIPPIWLRRACWISSDGKAPYSPTMPRRPCCTSSEVGQAATRYVVAPASRSPKSRFTGVAGSAPTMARSTRVERDLGERRSEEHTSELQSRQYLVCRLLLEKKKNNKIK